LRRAAARAFHNLPPAWLVREQGAEVVGECLPAVTDDRAWTTLDPGVKVVASR
jgi:hypothetical protein